VPVFDHLDVTQRRVEERLQLVLIPTGHDPLDNLVEVQIREERRLLGIPNVGVLGTEEDAPELADGRRRRRRGRNRFSLEMSLDSCHRHRFLADCFSVAACDRRSHQRRLARSKASFIACVKLTCACQACGAQSTDSATSAAMRGRSASMARTLLLVWVAAHERLRH